MGTRDLSHRRLQPRLAPEASVEKRACIGERHSTGWDLFQRQVTHSSIPTICFCHQPVAPPP